MSNSNPSAVVIAQPFGTYAKGQLITDAETIAAIQKGGNWKSVIPTQIHTHYPSAVSSSGQE